MKLSKLSIVVFVVAFAAVLVLAGMVSAGTPAPSAVTAAVTPIPWEGPTNLPAFTGAPVKAHPLPPANAPQNPFLAPNPFGNAHNDTWMSDTYDIAGPLGRDPIVWSVNVAAALNPGATSPAFLCGSLSFDSYGRIVTVCSSYDQTTAVLVDPNSLEVLTHLDLPAAGNQAAGMGAGYMVLDNLDRAWSPIGDQIIVMQQNGAPDNTTFSSHLYDLSSVVPAGDVINSLVPDYKGRIWFVVRYSGRVGVLDPATGTARYLQLGSDEPLGKGEQIANSFAMDGLDAYIVTTGKLYRLTAAADNVPYVVWSAGYENIGTQKPGQLSAGSGTTPTILDHGKYVAIADNASQTHVVVYRTAERLGPKEERLVCEVPVFQEGKGAVEDSLVGSGRSLIASNNYGFVFNPKTLISTPTEPGVARVDIDPNGKGCHAVWTNGEVNPGSFGAKLSTRTGLAYVLARKLDPSVKTADYPNGMNVWYWTAIDFRTGKTVWEQLAGTGRWFDGYWPITFLGPNRALYAAGYGGIFAVRDAR
jgi:hypothetical protein